MTWRLALIPVVIVGIFLGSQMAFGKDLVLMSDLNGRLVTTDGAPASGVKITRTWKWAWNQSEGADETVTDAEGKFSFQMVTGRAFFAGILPHEPSVFQELTAESPDGPVSLWYARKSSYDDQSELEGRPFRIVCTLSKEPIDGALYYGTCFEDK